MKIDNLKDLKALLKACHEHGVHNIEIDGIKMQIGEPKSAAAESDSKPIAPTYTEEDLLMWSAGGHITEEAQ